MIRHAHNRSPLFAIYDRWIFLWRTEDIIYEACSPVRVLFFEFYDELEMQSEKSPSLYAVKGEFRFEMRRNLNYKRPARNFLHFVWYDGNIWNGLTSIEPLSRGLFWSDVNRKIDLVIISQRR